MNREIIFAVRMKVEVETITDIPRTLYLRKGDVTILLVVDIEVLVTMFQDLNRDGWGGDSQQQHTHCLEIG